MAKKNLTLLHKASILLKLSIFLAKLKKPIIPMLVSLKKSRNFKKLQLLKPYDHYSYVKDYEFSPSNTPLIQFQRKFKRDRRIGSFRKVYSNFVVISECFGLGKERYRGREMMAGLEALPASCGEEENGLVVSISRELMVMGLTECSYGSDEQEEEEEDEDESSSVDERAERFIQRFYEDIKRQRRGSHLQIREV